MRILLLTQWFEPEPVFKGLLFAKALKDAGHEVEVLTGFPNYPSGKIYPGYRVKWLHKEVILGILIVRVPLYPSHGKSVLGRIFNYMSFAVSSCLYGLFGAKRPDIIYIYHPPMTVGVAGAIIGLFRRVPFVYDIQDIWPDTLQATGMLNNKQILFMIGKVCQWIYRRSAKIIVLSPGFKKLLVERGVRAEKIEIIYNWADEEILRNPVPSSYDMDIICPENFNIVFAGNMGKAQALESVLYSAKAIEIQNPAVKFTLIGGGIEVERLQQIVKDQKIGNINFVSHKPLNEIGNFLLAANVLLVHLKKESLFEITIPSKAQAYLAVGKPIIMAVSGDASALIEEAGAGYCIEPENSKALEQLILQLASMPPDELRAMGKRGRLFYEKKLAFSVGMKAFLKIFEQINFEKLRK